MQNSWWHSNAQAEMHIVKSLSSFSFWPITRLEFCRSVKRNKITQKLSLVIQRKSKLMQKTIKTWFWLWKITANIKLNAPVPGSMLSYAGALPEWVTPMEVPTQTHSGGRETCLCRGVVGMSQALMGVGILIHTSSSPACWDGDQVNEAMGRGGGRYVSG